MSALSEEIPAKIAASLAVGGLRISATPSGQWTREAVAALFALPLNDLLYAAQWVHRQHFDPNTVQVSTLLSIKTGRCPEDCAYCSQSVRFDTGLKVEPLMPLAAVAEAARNARAQGATRFCMGAAYRSPKDRDLEHIIGMIKVVRELGMEACLTLGMLTPAQSQRLAEAGLDYYNHNIDTSEDYYREIISTRTYADRLETLENVRNAGIKVCCGGIVGMGETRADRSEFLRTLATLPAHPDSVPINQLVRVPGTPLSDRAGEAASEVDQFEFVRTIAVARILMPKAQVRLSAGRMELSDEMQAMCFFAGANSIFYGDKLLTTDNPEANDDLALFARLGIVPEQRAETAG
jgi:biotin synthase